MVVFSWLGPSELEMNIGGPQYSQQQAPPNQTAPWPDSMLPIEQATFGNQNRWVLVSHQNTERFCRPMIYTPHGNKVLHKTFTKYASICYLYYFVLMKSMCVPIILMVLFCFLCHVICWMNWKFCITVNAASTWGIVAPFFTSGALMWTWLCLILLFLLLTITQH